MVCLSRFEDNMIIFDDQKFSKDLDTNFKGQNGVIYKMQDVWFMLVHRDKPWLQYVKGKSRSFYVSFFFFFFFF
jgi:hypothetical protein